MTGWGQDYLRRNDSPSGGVLFTHWTKIRNPIGPYPVIKGNDETFNLYGSNWTMRCVGGNINAPAVNNCGYNANAMMIADGSAFGQPAGNWLGDIAYLQDTGLPTSRVEGWVFIAWQILIGVSDVTVNQWVKYAGQPVSGPQSSTVTIAQLRQWAENNGWAPGSAVNWTPSAPTHFTIGTINDNCNAYYTRARLYARSTLPSNSEIEAIAANSGADLTAWGDWQLTWDTVGAAPILTDRSGNGRNLSVAPGGSVNQGVLF